MATVTSLGVGSGLDLESMVTKMVDLEKSPLTQLKTKAATVNAKISAFSQIKSLVSPLADAASSLNSLTTWNAVSTSSSNSAAVTASAIGGTVASSFSVQVQNLAKPQDYASAALTPSGAAVGSGTLTLTLGTWTPPAGVTPASFAPGAAAGVDISVSATDTITDIASKINGSTAGVTATVLTDASGERLLLRSKATGAVSGFQLSVNDTDGNNTDAAGLSRLVNGSSISQYAEDAKATLNGIAVTSSTNTFSNVVSGVSLTVAQVTTSAVTVSVSKDMSAIKSGIDKFVAAYNKLNDMLNDLTKYDPGTKSAGLLQGDSTAVNLQTAMRRMLSSVTSGGSLGRLADIGITQLEGGNLDVNSTKLSAALDTKLSDVKNLFKADTGNSNTSGVAVKFKSFTQGLLASSGFFSSKDATLKSQLSQNTKDQAAVNDRVSRFETALRRQYSTLDANVANMKRLNDYVTQQITAWNKSSNGN
jgi:flagellar hook-associated protein 2